MSSLFKGLDAFGMDDLDKNDLFEEVKKTPKDLAAEVVTVNEADLLYDRAVRCPVCDTSFNARTLKQGASNVLSTNTNLRPIYNNIDQIKYDVVLCEVCGYAAMNRNFKKITDRQIKLVREKISMKYVGKKYPRTYEYGVALERYKMALYNDMVIGRNDINKAYLCLKASWIIESLMEQCHIDKELNELKEMHLAYVNNAYKGFKKSYNDIVFPVLGMNQSTYQYLLGALAYEVGDMKATGDWLGKVVLSPISSRRIKDKAGDLRAKINENRSENNL